MTLAFAVPPGVAPAWDAVVLRNGEVVHAARGGETAPVLFDVASLTKPLVVGTLAALLVKEGRVGLDDAAADWLPRFRGGGKERVTVRQLLAHSSGLPWWRPWFERAMADPVAGPAFLPPAERPADLAAAFARGREIVAEGLWEEPLEARSGDAGRLRRSGLPRAGVPRGGGRGGAARPALRRAGGRAAGAAGHPLRRVRERGAGPRPPSSAPTGTS